MAKINQPEDQVRYNKIIKHYLEDNAAAVRINLDVPGLNTNNTFNGTQTVNGDLVVNGKLTVTGPIDPTYIEFTQIATPSNPAATKNRLYFKNDDSLYMKNSSGTETQVGGGSSVFGTGTANYVPRWTASNTIGNSQLYDSGTYVGINTASPNAKLHVNGALSLSVDLTGIRGTFTSTTNSVESSIFRGTLNHHVATGGSGSSSYGMRTDVTRICDATDAGYVFGYFTSLSVSTVSGFTGSVYGGSFTINKDYGNCFGLDVAITSSQGNVWGLRSTSNAANDSTISVVGVENTINFTGGTGTVNATYGELITITTTGTGKAYGAIEGIRCIINSAGDENISQIYGLDVQFSSYAPTVSPYGAYLYMTCSDSVNASSGLSPTGYYVNITETVTGSYSGGGKAISAGISSSCTTVAADTGSTIAIYGVAQHSSGWLGDLIGGSFNSTSTSTGRVDTTGIYVSANNTGSSESSICRGADIVSYCDATVTDPKGIFLTVNSSCNISGNGSTLIEGTINHNTSDTGLTSPYTYGLKFDIQRSSIATNEQGRVYGNYINIFTSGNPDGSFATYGSSIQINTNDSNSVIGSEIVASLTHTGVNSTFMYGIYSSVAIDNTGPASLVDGLFIQASATSGTGTLSNINGIELQISTGTAGKTISTYNGIVLNFSSAGNETITTATGITISALPSVATTRYGLYQSGSDDLNYFAGKVGIGVVPSDIQVTILDVVSTSSETGGGQRFGIRQTFTANPNDGNTNFTAMSVQMTGSAVGTNSLGSLIGLDVLTNSTTPIGQSLYGAVIRAQYSHTNSGVIIAGISTSAEVSSVTSYQSVYGITSQVNITGAGTFSATNPVDIATGSFTTYIAAAATIGKIACIVTQPTGGGVGETITDMYSLFLAQMNGAISATNRWGVYQEDTAESNFFAGVFNGFGTSTPFGSERLAISGDAYVDGKLTVTGLIDPTGMQFTQVGANPGTSDTVWVASGGTLMFGASAVGGASVGTSPTPFTLVAGANINIALPDATGFYYFNDNSGGVIMGIAGGVQGRVIVIQNRNSSNYSDIASESAFDPDPTRRIVTSGNPDTFAPVLRLFPGDTVTLGYNDGRWRVIGSSLSDLASLHGGVQNWSIENVFNGVTVLSGDVGSSCRTKILYAFQRGDVTPATITADQTDYDSANANVLRVSSNATRTINSIAPNTAPTIVNTAGRELRVVNVGSFNIVLKHLGAGTYKMSSNTGADITLLPGGSAELWWDYASGYYRLRQEFAGGSGTTGNLSRWTSANVLGNSNLSEATLGTLVLDATNIVNGTSLTISRSSLNGVAPHGLDIGMTIAGTTASGTIEGLYVLCTNNASGYTTYYGIEQNSGVTPTTGTITTVAGIRNNITSGSGGATITNLYGIKSDLTIGTNVGTAYGLYVTVSGAATTTYAAYISGGQIYLQGATTVTGTMNVGIVALPANIKSFIASGVATDNVLVVRGFTAQSADLTQWQDSSGSVLASVSSSGVVTGIGSGLTNLNASNISSGTMSVDRLSLLAPRWVKVTKAYTDLSAAALTNDIEVFSLPAGGVIHSVKIKHSTSFTGGAISAYSLTVGPTGDLQKYSGPFDVFQATGATIYQLTDVIGGESHTGATSIRLAATSVGANLNAATAGSVDVWILYSVAV